MAWISVRNWRTFQHYDPTKRQPPWIKVYTELMSSDSYLQLTAADRGILQGIWLEYASSRCELRDDTLTLTRRLSVKVSKRNLERLNHAGFIDIVASKTLAEGYQSASARAHATETETETEEEKEPSLTPSSVLDHPNGRTDDEPEIFEAPPLDLDNVLKSIPAA